MSIMSKEISVFSNNVFDLAIFSKKERIEMIENLINTISMLNLTNKVSTKVTSDTLDMLFSFGMINKTFSLSELERLLGPKLILDLLIAMNKLVGLDILKYPEIYKYNLNIRNILVEKEKKLNKPSVVDLFCGSGGLSLGLTQAGFRIVFANDIEKSALRTYAFNHPEIDGKNITLGGIENIAFNIHDYIHEDIDVLTGGPPCQGFSMANRQRVIDDPRNILYSYYVESVHNLQPKIFIMENVKGMVNVADQVIEDFNFNLKTEYNIDFKILNARNMGIPQNRERLIFIGVRKDIAEKNKITASIILELIENSYTENELGIMTAISDLKILDASQIKNSTKGDLISGFIIDKDKVTKKNNYVKSINMNRFVPLVFNHKARYNNERDIAIFDRMIPGDKSDSPRIADIMPYKSRSHMFKDKYFKLLPDVPCKTITAHMKFDCNMYIHPFQARGLTPREAARIQSYPDDYFFLGAFTKTFQQIGNSVPPLMARIIGNIVINYIED